MVTPDPIPARILPSGIAVELVEFCTPPPTQATYPRAMLNFMYHAGDGSGRLFVNDSRGKLWAVDRITGAATLFLDVAAARGAAFLGNGPPDWPAQLRVPPGSCAPRPARLSALLHHHHRNGVEPPRGRARARRASIPANLDNVVAEWRLDARSLSKIDLGSRREVLRIAHPAPDHCADQLMFNPNAVPGSGDYGKLYIGVGDGGNSPNNTDRYNQAQDPTSALGKILRIKPVKQADGSAYQVPADNPFAHRLGWLPEIWALGLRHPQNFSFDPVTGTMLITDCGQAQIEEVNLGRKGANYGWPLREGTFVTDRFDDATLYALPANDAVRNFTYPVAQYDHDEGNLARKSAITGGFVYRGVAIPALQGHYVLGDIVTGRVFHVPVTELKLGAQAVLRELTLTQGGGVVTLMALVGGPNRVDLRFGQDEAGELYVLTKQDGKIRKLAAAPG